VAALVVTLNWLLVMVTLPTVEMRLCGLATQLPPVLLVATLL
jgi:hypothetical protein